MIKTIFLVALIIASVAASLLVHAKAESASQEKSVLLQEQTRQLAALKTEQQRLSHLAATSAAVPAEDHTAELAKLRSRAEALRIQTNDLAKQLKLHLASLPSPAATSPLTLTPDYRKQMDQAVGTKQTEARDIAAAMYEYALDHQKQYPDGLDQIGPYLAKNHWVLSGTNQFEIIFHGSLDQLDGIPMSSIAAIRDSQTLLTPDGRQARVYGMIPGIGSFRTSDDNFQSWEAEHVISPPKSP
jgi:hypothetical protein